MKIFELVTIILAIVVILYQQRELREDQRQIELLIEHLDYWKLKCMGSEFRRTRHESNHQATV